MNNPELENEIDALTDEARAAFSKQIRQEERTAFRERVEHKRLTEPMDVTDESLADIASDTKGEAWMLGYNAALDNLLADDSLTEKPHTGD